MCRYKLCAVALQTASQEVRRNMAAYKEVRANMSEGLRFYMSLQEAIAVLAQQAGDYIMTRRLQRSASLGTVQLSLPNRGDPYRRVPNGCISTETMV